jgi:fatty-acyl-CoA synthase
MLFPYSRRVTLGEFLNNAAQQFGDHPALISAERTVSYTQLRDEARCFAKGLGLLGVSKGTRVGVLMPNRPEWLAGALGAQMLGAIVVPINTLLRDAELEYALRFADVTVLIAVSQFLKHDYSAMLRRIAPEIDQPARPIIARRLPALREILMPGDAKIAAARSFADTLAAGAALSDEWLDAMTAETADCEPATVFFTSGTTAAPKGAVHTHGSMLHAAHNVADVLGLNAADRTWGYLPFFFTGGFVAVALATLSRGGAVLLQEVFEPGAAIELMSDNAGTTLFAWPHQAEAIVAHLDFRRLPLRIRKGPGAQAPWAAAIFGPEHQAVGTWGMTESGPMASSTRFDDPLHERASAHGRATPGLEMYIADPDTGGRLDADQEGELCVRGASMMSHYYRMSPAECFDAAGFFHTGDLARIDAAGLLHFVGRLKDVIKTAGVNVAAADVEATLLLHPDIAGAYVVGVAHPARGENIAAFIVRRSDSLSQTVVLEFCRTQMATYKVPRHVFFITETELPVLGSGKVDKRALRERVSGLLG